jgi:PAS domain-containing protein
MRQLASHLAMPIFIVDGDGTLVFYNEPAERVLGQRFDETGEMKAGEWITADTATDESGHPLTLDRLPLMIAVRDGTPAHQRLWITGLDKVRRLIDVMALPLLGHESRPLGAFAVFWEVGER